MNKSYFLLKQQIFNIKERLKGQKIHSVFTWQKNELVLELDSNYLCIQIGSQTPYILLKDLFNIKGAKFPFFEQITGQHISSVNIHTFDKRVDIFCDTYTIVIFFYGRQPNIFLYRNNEICAHFKEYNKSILLSERLDLYVFPEITIEAFMIEAEKHSDLTLKKFISLLFGNLSATLISEILYRVKIDEKIRVNGINKEKAESLIKTFVKLDSELSDGLSYIYYYENKIRRLSLIRFYLFEDNGYNYEVYSDLNKAWSVFSGKITVEREYDKLYKKLSTLIEDKLNYLNRSLKKLSEFEDIRTKKEEAELKGNLLLTFQHQIKQGNTFTEVNNIFSEAQETVKIKLSPSKTIIENAQQYFNKYKNVAEKAQITEIKKQTLKTENEKILELAKHFKNADSLSNLKKMEIEFEKTGLIKTQVGNERKRSVTENMFKKIMIDEQRKIYIGKNGENNDRLTFQFAGKNDLWFHAQGVPGSHVILKKSSSEEQVPSDIIKTAARMAAGHSRAKHSANVPVIYTEVRYVSRIRKALPGTVNVRNEKVIFVEPITLN